MENSEPDVMNLRVLKPRYEWTEPFFALGNGSDRKVLLFCSPRGTPSDFPAVQFWVHNGCWEGVFRADLNELAIDGDPKRYPAKLLWIGDLPARGKKWDYNEAIEWIQEQVDDK